MAYVSLTAAQTDSDSPVDQTLMDTIRLDLDDHESRISAVQAFGNTGVVDDFMGKDATIPDTGSWLCTVTAGNTATTDAATHSLKLDSNPGAGIAIARVTDGRIGMKTNVYEVVTVLECRVKETSLDTGLMFGWQDRSLGDVAGRVTTTTNMIGFIKGTGTTWKFHMQNGGASTDVDSIGSPASWGVLRITTTCSATAGNRIVQVQSGATVAALADIAGSPFVNPANIPTGVYLSPSFGLSHVTGATLFFDYILAYTTTRPLAA